MFNIQSKNRDPSVDPPRLIANAIGRTTVFYRFVGASSNPTPPLPTHDCIVAQDQQQLSSINVTLLPNTHTLSGQTEDSPPLRIDHTRSLRWRRNKLPDASRAHFYHQRTPPPNLYRTVQVVLPRSCAVAIHLGRSAQNGPHARAGESGIPKGTRHLAVRIQLVKISHSSSI